MRYLIIFLFLVGCSNPDPRTADALHYFGLQGQGETRTLTSDDLEILLPKVAKIQKGVYQIPKPHEMPMGNWCGSPTLKHQFRTPGNCKDTSEWAANEMKGYAFGTAWFMGTKWEQGHMVNVAVVELESGVLELKYYEPQTCYWTYLERLEGIKLSNPKEL